MKETIEEAISYLKDTAKGHTVYCLGSLYLAGEIKALMREAPKYVGLRRKNQRNSSQVWKSKILKGCLPEDLVDMTDLLREG